MKVNFKISFMMVLKIEKVNYKFLVYKSDVNLFFLKLVL